MSIDTKHPQYHVYREDWRQSRDAYAGDKAVKGRGEHYLPKPSGFNAQKDAGAAAYDSYRKRAQFPEVFAPTVRGLTGTIHGSEWQIELPSALEPMFERATPDGQTLDTFSRRLTSEILIAGRYGVLTDLPQEGGDVPYLAGYKAETIINWDDDSSLFVLDESGYARDGFIWLWQNAWRVLRLDDGRYVQSLQETSDSGGGEIQPSARGGGSLDEIPFVVAGPKDLTPEVDEPPLIGVARAALAYYRLDADYRHQLYNSGQETLFIINGHAPEYVGAGVVHTLEAQGEHPPDAKYVGPSGATISAHREARSDELLRAADAGARMFGEASGANESGEARRLRFSSETANLKTIAMASAAALERSLKHAACLVGANEDEVIVKAPQRMLEPVMAGQEALQLVQAWQGGGFSYETLHDNLQRGQIISPDKTADDEARLLDDDEFTDEQML